MCSDIIDSELYIPNYNVFRLDRNRNGGGVAMFIHKSIHFNILLLGPLGLEFVLVTLIRDHLKLCLGVFYRPPSSRNSIFDTFSDALLTINQSCLSDLIIIGDFNVNFHPSHYMYAHLLELLCNFSLSQIAKCPTRFSSTGHSSTIDLVLVSRPNNVENCTSIPKLANSDHLGLFLTLKKYCPLKERVIRRQVWRYSLADFDRAAELIEMTNWEMEFYSNDIDSCVSAWNSTFLQIMEVSIPHSSIKVKGKIPWINKEIIRAITKRNILFN